MMSPEFSSLTAEWAPSPGSGWSVTIEAFSRGEENGPTNIRFYSRDFYSNPGTVCGWMEFYPGLGWWKDTETFADVSYSFSVSLDGPAIGGDQLRLWRGSAEALESFGLRRIDELEAAITRQVSDGTAVISAWKTIVTKTRMREWTTKL